MNPIHKTFFWVSAGAFLALFLNGTISAAVNPLLTTLKISVSAPGS